MLICGDEKGREGCGHGWHIHCLVPPLTSVPEEDWFCVECSGDAVMGDQVGIGSTAGVRASPARWVRDQVVDIVVGGSRVGSATVSGVSGEDYHMHPIPEGQISVWFDLNKDVNSKMAAAALKVTMGDGDGIEVGTGLDALDGCKVVIPAKYLDSVGKSKRQRTR